MKAHPGGRLEISRTSLRALTALAWRLQPFQISGGPAWVRSEYFNVDTEAAESPPEDRLFLMIRNLLAERFALRVHFETAERPVYLLVPDKTRKTRAEGLHVSIEGSCDPNACGLSAWGRTIWKRRRFPWLDLRKRYRG